MSNDSDSPTLVERWIHRFKKHPIFLAIGALVALLTFLEGATKSISSLVALVRPAPTVRALSPADAKLEAAVIGTWTQPFALPLPTGVSVPEFRFVVMKNGTINWRGEYVYAQQRVPILVSGKWRIEDGRLLYDVTSSNVPLFMKEGFSSAVRIESISEAQMTVYDEMEGGRVVVTRVP